MAAGTGAGGRSAHWWVNLQVTFGLAGGAIWLGGTFFEQEFVAGVGAGLILAALLLRMGRTDAEDRASPEPDE